jgi:flagellar hook-associated protein 3 FlgL
MRVSTFGQSALLTQYMSQLQSRVADATVQQASGLKSESYSGLEGNTKKLLDLDGEMARSAAYISNGDAAVSRINTMYEALQSVSDLATQVRTLVSSNSSGTDSTTENLQEEAKGMLDDLAAALNQQYAGDYLFSGTAANTEPVDLTALTTPTVPTSADTSYYQGDDGQASAKVADSTTISYGVNASDPSIEKLVRALNIIAYADPLDEEALTEAGLLAEESSNGVANLMDGLSSSSNRIQDVVDRQTDIQLYADSWISDITDVDVAEVQVRLSTLETSLEATMQAIAAFQKLSLADYF